MYSWGDDRRFNSYSGHFGRVLGGRVQKVAINAGFGCPNRDGSVGRGGCTFCNNEAFTPSYCTPEKSIVRQIDEGIEFHRNRYRKAERYLAYFQSYSNTYAPLPRLREVYDEALSHPDIAGIVVGTRPDCVDEAKLDYFAALSADKYVAIEYGVESTFDSTLAAINRGHDFACARRAIEMTSQRGIHCGAHFILGLPGESREMMIEQTRTINALPIDTVKFHQLQIFKGTAMERHYAENPQCYTFWQVDEYIDFFIKILRRLRPDIVLERFAGEAPPRYHAGPCWGLLRNEQLWNMLDKRLSETGYYQGELYCR